MTPNDVRVTICKGQILAARNDGHCGALSLGAPLDAGVEAKISAALGGRLDQSAYLLAAAVKAGLMLVGREVASNGKLVEWMRGDAKKAELAHLGLERTALIGELTDALNLQVAALGKISKVCTDVNPSDSPRVRMLKAQLAYVEYQIEALGGEV